VPQVLRDALVTEAHGQLLIGHDGISKTKERLKESYFWPNMDASIAKHIKACQRCQKRKDDRPQPTKEYTSICLDPSKHLAMERKWFSA